MRNPLVLASVALTACGGSGAPSSPDAAPSPDAGTTPVCPGAFAAHPDGAATVPAPEPPTPVAASFTVTIDLTDAALAGTQREPQARPLTIARTSGSLRVTGGAKRFATHADRLFVELYAIDDGADGVAGATATIGALTGATALRDLTIDPLAAPTDARTIALGGIAPEGTARLRVGLDVPAGTKTASFTLTIAGTITHRTAASRAPFADADTVAILDAKTSARAAQIPLSGAPTGVAITPDGTLALVTCRACNLVAVIDVAQRQVVQLLGEGEGIGRDPRHVVVSPDGARAYVSAYVGDTVTALERVGDRFRVAKTIAVGRRPTGLSVTPDGKTVYVAHFLPRGPIRDNEAWVSVIDADALALAGEAVLRDDGDQTEAGCLAKTQAFAGYSADLLTFEATPTQLAGVFLAPGGAEAWVPALRVAGFPIFEGDPSALGFMFLSRGANSPAMLFPLDTRAPRAPGFRKVPAIVDITDRTDDFLACVPATDDSEGVRVRAGTTPDETVYPGVTIPSQATMLDELGAVRFVGYSRGGRRALALSYLADELAVLDGTTHSPVARHHLVLSGSNPTGLAVSPDGARAYVAYEDSPFVSVLDLAALAKDGALPEPTVVPYRLDPGAAAGQGAAIITFLQLTRTITNVPDVPAITEVAQIPLVDHDLVDPVVRRGKILFNSSNPIKYPTLSASAQAACAACHPDGGADGSAWSTMEGERRTIPLWGGVAGRGWLHASATHRSVVDFATTIVKERLGGTGLSADDVHALSTYVARGIPELQRPAVDPALAARGAALFASDCAQCHVDAKGGGHVDASDPYGGGTAAGPQLVDLDTATAWAGVTLSQAFTHLFPPVAKRVLDELRGDRALGDGDDVQNTLHFTARPNRARGKLKPPPLVDVYDAAVLFHDARFTSLDEAVGYLDQELALGLSADDKRALIAYLTTL
jgi:DNA-binding beta-propeller fold protein YncE